MIYFCFKDSHPYFRKGGFFIIDMITLERAKTDIQIQQILDLQKLNLKKNLSQEEIETQGFVTAEHTFDQLKHINDFENAIIAVENDKVVGYAIAMIKEAGAGMPIFEGLFETVDSLFYKEKPVPSYPYIFVGQLCVAKEYRGIGLVSKLYDFFKEELKDRYDFSITDINENNPRSLKAHSKSGYEPIHTFYDKYTSSNWIIVLQDFKK